MIRVFTEQVYSNCPKYIQARSWETREDTAQREAENVYTRHSSLTDQQSAWVARADDAGNNMFQTLGNISVNPRTGLLFIDFEHGATLQLSGSSRIVWDATRAAAFPGAQRLIELDVEAVVEIAHATRLRWRLLDYSPFNPAA